MKTILKISAVLSLFLLSCSSMQQTAVNDDLYYSPKDKHYTNELYAYEKSETGNGKSYVNNKEIDQKISALLEDTLIDDLDTLLYQDKSTGNPYEDIIVDSYDEAYQRRIDAKSSGALPNFLITTSNDYQYASIFLNDPYYTVVIYGDQVWVEPRWISTSFGFNSYPYYGYYGYYGYYDPYYYDPFYYSYYRPYYYNYYRPYYYPYYYGYPYYSMNNYYYGGNNNWASSGNNSFRRRGTTTINPDGLYRAERSSRNLPENYIGSDIRKTRSLKEGIDDQASRTTLDGRTTRVREKREGVQDPDGITRVREKREGIQDPERSSRVTGKENTGARQEVTRKRTSTEGSANNQTYTRTPRQSTSTYDASKRNNSTRYTRPQNSTSGEKTSVGTRSSSGSTYAPTRSDSPTRSSSGGTRSSSGGTKYTPARSSSGNSSGTVRSTPSKSSSGSSGNSGSSRSSGSSGNSNNSSGSSRGGRR